MPGSRTPQRHPWTDARVEQLVGNLLRGGVLFSAMIVIIGAAIYLVQHGREMPHYGMFRGEPESLRNVGSTLQAAWEGHGRGWIQLGLLVLIATPIARVLLTVFAFGRQRDFLYVAISLIVLTFLTISIWCPLL